MRWKSYEEQLRQDAVSCASMSPEERLNALFSMVDFVIEMLRDTGALADRLGLYEQVEEEGHERWREWVRRHRA